LTCVRASQANALRKNDAASFRLIGSNRTSPFTDPDQTGQTTDNISKTPRGWPTGGSGQSPRAYLSRAPNLELEKRRQI
jgi:hypothetical protein